YARDHKLSAVAPLMIYRSRSPIATPGPQVQYWAHTKAGPLKRLSTTQERYPSALVSTCWGLAEADLSGFIFRSSSFSEHEKANNATIMIPNLYIDFIVIFYFKISNLNSLHNSSTAAPVRSLPRRHSRSGKVR